LKKPLAPENVCTTWTWQVVGVVQWWIRSVHESAEPGRVPSSGSVACPEKSIRSPTAYVSDDDGESITGTGGAFTGGAGAQLTCAAAAPVDS
jgi:hypothetical protein